MPLFQENIVIIDRGGSQIRGLLVRRGLGAFDILRKESLPALPGGEESPENPEEYNLLRFIHTVFPDESIFAIPANPDELFTRTLDVPAADLKLALEVLPGDLETMIPVPLEDVEIVALPWQKGTESTRMIAFALETRRLIELTGPFTRSGKSLAMIAPAAHMLACALRFLPAHEYAGRGVGQVHIGYESTIFNLLIDGRLVYSRSLPVGGRRFTTEIAEAAGRDETWAEQFKREAGLDLSSRTENEIPPSEISRYGLSAAKLRRIRQAVREAVSELAGEMERTILASPVREPAHIYVSGGGSLLRGVMETLEDDLNLRTRRYPLQLGEEAVDEWIVCLGGVQATGLSRGERADFLLTPAGGRLRSGALKLNRFILPAAMMGAAAFILLTSFIFTMVSERSQLAAYREQTQKIAGGIAGINATKNPVGEARSLCQNRLRIMRSMLGGYRTLDILKEITEHTADPQTARLQLKSIRYNESDVEIDMQVDNIQQTQPIQEQFQKSSMIASVEVVHRDLLPAQKVRLTLKLVLKPPQTGIEVDCR